MGGNSLQMIWNIFNSYLTKYSHFNIFNTVEKKRRRKNNIITERGKKNNEELPNDLNKLVTVTPNQFLRHLVYSYSKEHCNRFENHEWTIANYMFRVQLNGCNGFSSLFVLHSSFPFGVDILWLKIYCVVAPILIEKRIVRSENANAVRHTHCNIRQMHDTSRTILSIFDNFSHFVRISMEWCFFSKYTHRYNFHPSSIVCISINKIDVASLKW